MCQQMMPERPIKSTIIVTSLRLLLIVWIALLPGLCASGQVKFTTVVSSQEVGEKDYLEVEYMVENARQIDDITPPTFPGFHIVQGPIQSSGMSIVNGAVSQYKGLAFVLQPVRTGKYSIGGASATIDGRPMRSNTVVITVHAGGTGAAPQGAGNSIPGSLMPSMNLSPFEPEPRDVDRDYILKPGENVKEKIKKNLFVKVQVDKNSCYVGEPIVATYKLYSRLSSESRVTRRPSLNGFSVYDMVDPASDQVSVEKLGGKDFTVHIIRKTQLIPLQAGNIDLDPVEVENTVHFVKAARPDPRRTGSMRDLLDQMMSDNDLGPAVDENVVLDTKPVTITVKPLPENKPANYNGAVGNFSIEASLPYKTVAAQDEATLHVVVKGKGNIPVLTAPVVDWPSGFEAFEPTAKEEVNKIQAPMSGYKSFDYTFSPRTPGHYTIPAVNFSYFDPASQTYKSTGTQPLEIQVTPSVRKSKSAAGAPIAAASTPSSEFSRLGHFVQDHLEWIFATLLISVVAIYFWRQNSHLKKTSQENKPAPAKETARTGLPTIQPVPSRDNAPVAAAAVKKETEVQPTPGMTSVSYVPVVPTADPLQDARNFLESGDSKGFYREVNRALWKAIGRKLNLPASDLNKQNSIRQLQLRGWDETAIMSLENILNECEMNLYTPAYDRYNMQQLLKQSEWMLDRLI